MRNLACVAATLLIALPAFAQQPATESTWARFQRGMSAYQEKDFATCATLLTAVSADPASRSGETRYNAACCQALSGHPDKAVPLLEQASVIDLLAVKQVEEDADLAAVRALPAWPELRTHLVERERKYLAGLDIPLRKELGRRVTLDQDIRDRAMSAGQPIPKNLSEEWERIDRDNTAWAKKIMAERGWLGSDVVGNDGSGSFFLLVQHADSDRPFQKLALEKMEVAVAQGHASASQLAYLTDRVLIAESKPQRYGTQMQVIDGKPVPMPIEDAVHVDARRLKLGLPTMAEYIRFMEQNQPKPAAATGAEKLAQLVQHVPQFRRQRRIQNIVGTPAIEREAQ